MNDNQLHPTTTHTNSEALRVKNVVVGGQYTWTTHLVHREMPSDCPSITVLEIDQPSIEKNQEGGSICDMVFLIFDACASSQRP